MASSARRDPLRELAHLVRVPEPASSNLGEFLADNASGLAQVLGVPTSQLEAGRGLDDEEIAPRIRQLLERARERHVQEYLKRRRQRSLEAAQRLGATVRWTDLGAELNADLLLGELMADRSKRWVSFSTDEGASTIIPRYLIAAAAPLRRIHIDLACWLDPQGMHFRWKGGRGGYNWRARDVDPRFNDQVLVVTLAPRICSPVRQRQRGGAWLGQILREMGYVV